MSKGVKSKGREDQAGVALAGSQGHARDPALGRTEDGGRDGQGVGHGHVVDGAPDVARSECGRDAPPRLTQRAARVQREHAPGAIDAHMMCG